jgi:hypothetical protein
MRISARTMHTFLRIFPRICASRFSPSKHIASKRPFPSIFITCAYSCPSSRNTNSRLSSSFSFFPRLLFLPPCETPRLNTSGGEGNKRHKPFLYSARLESVLTYEVRQCAGTHLWHVYRKTSGLWIYCKEQRNDYGVSQGGARVSLP